MRFVLTALILLGGIFYTLTGVGFLVQPENSAAGFGIAVGGIAGASTVRADMTAFFLVSGVAMIWGAWKRSGDVLLVPAALFAVAFTGRLVSVFADGTYNGYALPMGIELLTVVLTVLASRLLPHHDLEDFESVS